MGTNTTDATATLPTNTVAGVVDTTATTAAGTTVDTTATTTAGTTTTTTTTAATTDTASTTKATIDPIVKVEPIPEPVPEEKKEIDVSDLIVFEKEEYVPPPEKNPFANEDGSLNYATLDP